MQALEGNKRRNFSLRFEVTSEIHLCVSRVAVEQKDLPGRFANHHCVPTMPHNGKELPDNAILITSISFLFTHDGDKYVN